MTELDRKLDKILQLYADIDPDELGEDKFTGHHSTGMARDAIKALFTQALTSLKSEMEKKKDYKNGKPEPHPDYECECGYGYDDCICEWNHAISECQRLLEGLK